MQGEWAEEGGFGAALRCGVVWCAWARGRGRGGCVDLFFVRGEIEQG